jgi:hypothetical protein
VPSAPLNKLAMLTDYITPEQRLVACPNQDVVYGVGLLALDQSPVVIQVPDFGDRFWVYQVVDLRTDGFVQLGKMYGTTPGFYLLAGPNWLTLYVQAESPGSDRESNWLPSPKDDDFSLYVRTYWPKVEVTDGSWTPPPVQKAN